MALTGALSVLLIVASFVVWGNTPKDDARAAEVFAHYSGNRTQGLIAAALHAVSTIPLLACAASLRQRARAVMPDSMLPSFAFGAGIVAAAGFIGAAGVRLALSDYARNIDLAAARALNALDADSVRAVHGRTVRAGPRRLADRTAQPPAVAMAGMGGDHRCDRDLHPSWLLRFLRCRRVDHRHQLHPVPAGGANAGGLGPAGRGSTGGGDGAATS